MKKFKEYIKVNKSILFPLIGCPILSILAFLDGTPLAGGFFAMVALFTLIAGWINSRNK